VSRVIRFDLGVSLQLLQNPDIMNSTCSVCIFDKDFPCLYVIAWY
jgi:hypothetical protein